MSPYFLSNQGQLLLVERYRSSIVQHVTWRLVINVQYGGPHCQDSWWRVVLHEDRQGNVLVFWPLTCRNKYSNIISSIDRVWRHALRCWHVYGDHCRSDRHATLTASPTARLLSVNYCNICLQRTSTYVDHCQIPFLPNASSETRKPRRSMTFSVLTISLWASTCNRSSKDWNLIHLCVNLAPN